jgi:endonuclease YncB( thermonuclease family)
VKRIADDTLVNEWILTIVHPDDTIDPLRVTHTREWQSPSYLLNKEDTSLTEYLCDLEEAECKINLKVTPMLDGVESSQLTCEITTDFELIPTTDPCNPNTSTVPRGDHILTINILDKVRGTVLQTSALTLKNPEKEKLDPTRVVTELVWQQPTYFLEKDDTSRESYTCDTTKDLCRFNLQVLPKLDGEESPRSSTCQNHHRFRHSRKWLQSQHHRCTRRESHSQLLKYWKWPQASSSRPALFEIVLVSRPQILVEVVEEGVAAEAEVDDEVLHHSISAASQILVQSGLDESYTVPDGYLSGEFWYRIVPAWALCEWDFWGGIFETRWNWYRKCNPGYVKFAADATVRLTVRDPNTSSNALTKTITVKKEKTQNQHPTEASIFAKIDLQTKVTANKRLTEKGIICALGKAEKCSLNFTGENSVGWKKWFWDFWDGNTADRKNPGAHSFSRGKYTVHFTASDWDSSHSATYEIEIVKEFPPEPCIQCERMRWLVQISAVLANPPRADSVEWIEIRNNSSEAFSLSVCEISDDSRSYELSWTLSSGKTLRLRQAITGITLGNTRDTLTLTCGGVQIDSFAWDFTIPTNYILRREILYWVPEQAVVTKVVDGDTVDATIAGVKTRIRLLGIDTPETVHPKKPLEKFWKEASDFTRSTLEWKTVWLTYDHEPIDHYGRRLAYIWQCSGPFSETACILFNAQIVSQGYGRMERRFQFRFYDEFITEEKTAKDLKKGIWSDPEVAKEMNQLASEEKELLESEQEKEFLKLQEELLEECLEEEIEWCEEEKISWTTITEKLTTLTVSPKKIWTCDDFRSDMVRFSSTDWDNSGRGSGWVVFSAEWWSRWLYYCLDSSSCWWLHYQKYCEKNEWWNPPTISGCREWCGNCAKRKSCHYRNYFTSFLEYSHCRNFVPMTDNR